MGTAPVTPRAAGAPLARARRRRAPRFAAAAIALLAIMWLPEPARAREASGLELPHLGLSAAPGSERLYPALIESTAQIGAAVAWDAGLTGVGQTIAVIDTGVEVTHPMLSPRVIAEACFTESPGACPDGSTEQTGPGSAAPCSGVLCNHGTHVASIAAGSAQPSGLRGVASSASIVAIQVFTPGPTGPSTSEAEILRALDWVFGQRDAYSFAAVNISIASNTARPAPCPSAAFQAAVARMASVGIAVVAAAGNSASLTGLAFPACVSGVVSVGSSSAANTVSSFSNRSPALTLLAPGEQIVAAGLDGSTSTLSGTSSAAPHVAGSLAVLRQREPERSLDELLALLQRTADPAADLVVNAPAVSGTLRLDRALDERYRVGGPLAESVTKVEQLVAVPGGVAVRGYTIDSKAVLPSTVVAVVDGVEVLSRPADEPRPELADLAPGYGSNHGFSASIPVPGGQPHVVCIGVRGTRDAVTTTAQCATLEPPSGSPFGSLDVVRRAPGGVRVEGWVIDPDVADAVAAHVYVDGVLVSGVVADGARFDVGGVFPGYGAGHGFASVVPVGVGAHVVCVYGIDVGVGENALVGCRSVSVSSDPFGSLDVVRWGAPNDPRIMLTVEGWALDPDSADPIDVHVYADGRLVGGGRADRARTDVGAAFPDFGPYHAYAVAVSAPAASAVCVYAVNVLSGANTLIGCRR